MSTTSKSNSLIRLVHLSFKAMVTVCFRENRAGDSCAMLLPDTKNGPSAKIMKNNKTRRRYPANGEEVKGRQEC
jgi:hypothetical protein